jgi:hypothetical protein
MNVGRFLDECLNGLVYRCAEQNVIVDGIAGFGGLNLFIYLFFPLSYILRENYYFQCLAKYGYMCRPKDLFI